VTIIKERAGVLREALDRKAEWRPSILFGLVQISPPASTGGFFLLCAVRRA
jgi:hypothetical protein